jgi:hypothetical protein
MEPKERTEDNIAELKAYLSTNNIFFSKVNSLVGTCLLKLNRLLWFEQGEEVLRQGEGSPAFYVILCGKLMLYTV